jgi:hypothetical protein
MPADSTAIGGPRPGSLTPALIPTRLDLAAHRRTHEAGHPRPRNRAGQHVQFCKHGSGFEPLSTRLASLPITLRVRPEERLPVQDAVQQALVRVLVTSARLPEERGQAHCGSPEHALR